MKPHKYDIKDTAELERLLSELSGYLAEDKEVGRKAFLEDGTDLPGRQYALAALDEIRRMRPFSQPKSQGVFDPDKEIVFATRCNKCGAVGYIRLAVGDTLDMAICECALEGVDEETAQVGDQAILATGRKVFELMNRPRKEDFDAEVQEPH